MAVTTSRRRSEVARFTPAQRWAHRLTAVLMGVCVATAACLYLPFLAELVGRRALVVTLHTWSGVLLPAPFLAGLASRAFRGDLRLLNRFGAHDKVWLRSALRRRAAPRPPGNVKPGAKQFPGGVGGGGRVMVGTGLRVWFNPRA
ncbi:formate dehydrogenase, partial [Streptomyces sp. NPDC059037]